MPNAYKMNAVIQADCFQIRIPHSQKSTLKKTNDGVPGAQTSGRCLVSLRTMTKRINQDNPSSCKPVDLKTLFQWRGSIWNLQRSQLTTPNYSFINWVVLDLWTGGVLGDVRLNIATKVGWAHSKGSGTSLGDRVKFKVTLLCWILTVKI